MFTIGPQGRWFPSLNMFPDPETGVNEAFHFPLMDVRLIGRLWTHVKKNKKLSMILTLRIKEINISNDVYLKKLQAMKKINKESQVIWTQFPSFH